MNGEEKSLALSYWEIWREHHEKDAQVHRQDIKDLKSDMHEIKESILKLPCKVRMEETKGIKLSIAGLYIIVGYLIYNLIQKYIGGA